MKITPGKDVASLPDGKEVQRLRSACEEFEAFLLSFMFKRALQPVLGFSLFTSQEESWFREMWVDEVTRRVARQGSMGIAELLFRQLLKERDSM